MRTTFFDLVLLFCVFSCTLLNLLLLRRVWQETSEESYRKFVERFLTRVKSKGEHHDENP